MKDDAGGEAVEISREALASLAAKAASEVEGVAICHQKAVDTLTSRVKREFIHKGVKVDREDTGYRLTLYLRVPFGVHLPSLSEEVRDRVKEYVQGITEVEIEQVDIVVEDIDLEE